MLTYLTTIERTSYTGNGKSRFISDLHLPSPDDITRLVIVSEPIIEFGKTNTGEQLEDCTIECGFFNGDIENGDLISVFGITFINADANFFSIEFNNTRGLIDETGDKIFTASASLETISEDKPSYNITSWNGDKLFADTLQLDVPAYIDKVYVYFE